MIKNIITVTAFSVLLASCGQETDMAEKASGAAVMSEASYAENVKTLASDAFEGRGTGSKGEDMTIAFLEKSFKEAGLEPANGDSYIQNVPLVSIEAATTASLDIAGGNGDTDKLVYGEDQVIWTRRVVESISVSDSELVFVGYGINAPERGWNDYEGIDVKGKTVVILINDPGYATQDEALFNGNSMTYYGRWGYKFDEAAAQGAAGAIIIHNTKPAAYPFSVVQSSWTGAQFSMERADKGMSLASFEAWITHDKAKAIFERAGLDLASLEAAATKSDFKAVAMNLTASAKLDNSLVSLKSRNVAGIIKGSETPEEVFIYMGHWDHLGFDTSIEGDGIYNGALDNATGTAGLIELAKAFKSLPQAPKRSIMFLAVTAEEQGLLGSAYYATNPLVPLANTVGGLNMDGLNNFGATKDVTVVGLGNSELDIYLENEAKKTGRYLRPDSTPEKGYFYRSDHFELAKLGVPMIYPGSGIDHIEKGEAYGLAKDAEYVKNYYHQPSDEYREDWVFTGAIADLTLYYGVGAAIAASSDWPAWYEGTEFKAARDAQLAAKP